MNAASKDLWNRFLNLKVWSSGSERAPNKPLLALWALGRCLNGEERMPLYALVDRELTELLEKFGPVRKAIHTEQPFWRMRNDGVWEIDRPELVMRTLSGDAYKSSLMQHDIRGGFFEKDYDLLRRGGNLAWSIAESLLHAHFPATRHDEILRAVGMNPSARTLAATPEADDFALPMQQRRDAEFRRIVLDAYGGQCAVCAYGVRVEGNLVGVEAAHIRWRPARGPNEVRNGLALCMLHHKLFDEGAFTLTPRDLVVAVAAVASGPGFDDWLGRFRGRRLRIVPRAGEHPHPNFLRWHGRQVFRSPEEIY